MFTEMKSASRVNGYLFIIFMAGMFLYSVPMLINYLTRNVENFSELTNGEVMRSFEKFYDKNIFLHKPSLNTWSLIQYQLFKEGSPGVVVGEEGWLFTKEEFLRTRHYDEQLDSALKSIKHYADSIKANGKNLILVPVPMKVDIYREYIDFKVNRRTKNLHEDFVKALMSHNIDTIDLKPSFLANKDQFLLYLKTDTHWTPEGANLAALTIADHINNKAYDKSFVTHKLGSKNFHGDLMNYFGLDELKTYTDLRPDVVNLYETFSDVSGVESIDLFSDDSINIVLVGTSYTKLDTWNFPGFVKQAISSDLYTVANEAKGPLASMMDFIDSQLFLDTEIETIIWEFPVRTILQQ